MLVYYCTSWSDSARSARTRLSFSIRLSVGCMNSCKLFTINGKCSATSNGSRLCRDRQLIATPSTTLVEQTDRLRLDGLFTIPMAPYHCSELVDNRKKRILEIVLDSRWAYRRSDRPKGAVHLDATTSETSLRREAPKPKKSNMQ